MADRISTGELGRRPGQGRVNLLLVGDATRYFLAGSMQKFFPSTAQITLTISNVKKVAVLLAANSFDIIFLKVTSTLTAEEQEAAKLIRSGKKKNTHLLFAFVIPERLKGYVSEYGADISFSEPLTLEKVNTVIHYWKTYFTNTDMENTELPPECRLYFQTSRSELGGRFSTDMFLCSELLKNDARLGLKAPLSSLDKSKQASFLHSTKEKLRREDAMLTSAFSPVQEIQLLADRGLNVYSMTAAGGALEGAVRGQPGSVSESSIEDLYKTRVPSTARSLNSFHSVKYTSGTVSPHEAAARTNQNISTYLPPTAPSVSNFIPQHCNAMLCPARPTSPNCLCTPGHELAASSRAASASIFRGFRAASASDHQASQPPALPSPQPHDSSYMHVLLCLGYLTQDDIF